MTRRLCHVPHLDIAWIMKLPRHHLLFAAVGMAMLALPLHADRPLAWQETPVEVKGTKKFRLQVAAALKLLETKAPDVHELVRQHVAVIAESRRSGMRADLDLPTFELAGKSAFHSLTWCAATIAHDAYHSKLYHDHLRTGGKPVPAAAWTGVAAEKACIAYQLEALKQVGAPQHEIDYCLTLKGDHFDVNKDGKYDRDDYRKRNW